MDERVAALLAAAEQNDGLRDALGKSASVEETVRIASEHGVPVTAEELTAAEADRDASDEELETSSAGVMHTYPGPFLPCV